MRAGALFAALILIAGCGDKGDDDSTVTSTGAPPFVPQAVDLDNFGGACGGNLAFGGPSVGEEAGLVVTAFQATDDFEIQRVEVSMVVGEYVTGYGTCVLQPTYDVVVWKQPASQPMPVPEPELTVVNAAAPAGGSTSLVQATLPTPLFVAPTEYVFAGVRLSGVWPDASCIQICPDGEQGNDDYLAPETAAPYGWIDTGFGTNNAKITVHGMTTQPGGI